MPIRPNPRKQRGVVLFITMIALVILLLSCIALIRSTDTSVLISGNLAIKRDLTNEAEHAIQAALAQFNSGGLVAETTRWGNVPAANYSATVLASNAQGVPNILFDTDPNFSALFSAPQPAAINGLTYRYVIDRMCPSVGDPSAAPNSKHCVSGNSVADSGGNARNPTLVPGGTPSPRGPVVYRISVRVSDVRQTQSFVQTTVKSFGS